MADEPVLVMKSQPMKAGNSVEDKTEMTIDLRKFNGLLIGQKLLTGAKGGSN